MGVSLASWLAGGGSKGGGGGRAVTEKPAVCERAAERGKRKSERRAARHASPHRHCRSEYLRLCCRSPLPSAPLSSPSFSLQCLLFVIIVCHSVFYVCTDVFICHVVSETPACHWQLTFGLNLQRAEPCWCWFWCWCFSPGSSDLCCRSVFFLCTCISFNLHRRLNYSEWLKSVFLLCQTSTGGGVVLYSALMCSHAFEGREQKREE